MKTLQPNWPAPPQVKAHTTLRTGGISPAPYHELNLGAHVGDHPEHVKVNRALVKRLLKLPTDPFWLRQTHSTIALKVLEENVGKEADASFTDQPNNICAILTADCLPILVCNRQGTQVAAIHAGWRGLAQGIIESTLDKLQLLPEDTLVWLGPAIGPACFEVGDEVRDLYLRAHAKAESAFIPSTAPTKWLANLYQLASLRLTSCGITGIYGGEHCTYTQKDNYFSYRRDGEKTGRMATLIWLME